jgi:hypothetical protein
MKLQTLLILVATVQIGIAILNLFLVRMMKWTEDLAKLPLLIREVVQVHSWFISGILLIFGILTLLFRSEFASGTNPVCAALAFSIATMWLFRTILQFAYYSSSHWKGRLDRTLIHIACLFVYGGMSTVYFLTALQAYPSIK